ncbi:GlxA family transcriptional regulator [Actinoallomurus rhizosphaericola]|uniref:GlxA family transcriptional regulator n=1 Tax=Actinoallomurus rhizosphaericola TaxID=2952536 RepID=UPI00209201B3|nr:helix-turn-helix domain-containing protein [Actinoallomurus rhizosphaericola]MCO5998534.1 helix-turn-helix domain-containing protein [Actinoallomurus rhizosphaericola]
MRTVGVVVCDGIRPFDYGVITEVWGVPRPGCPDFALWRCGERPVVLDHGVTLAPDRGLDALTECDLVVVPGRVDALAPVPAAVLGALRAAYEAKVPIASLCAGAFVLGAAGLLDGRRAVTHWALTGALAERHPAARIQPDVLFTEDGGIWTSAGTAAGIDLCLHLVRRAHGAAVANAIARRMVTAAHREGGQAQFVERPVPAPATAQSAVADTLEWARHHLAEPLSVADLARRSGTAPRTFARHFTQLTGTTPAHWLIRQRVAEAQRLLETTDLAVEQVAARTGFGTATMLRRHFARVVGVPPTSYRRTFAGSPAGA